MTPAERQRHDGSDISLDAPRSDPERDGVAALHDTEAEAGDEEGLRDMFDLDRTEARELGVNVDRADRGESMLD